MIGHKTPQILSLLNNQSHFYVNLPKNRTKMEELGIKINEQLVSFKINLIKE